MSNISEEEFLRLQNQIIELRTANYSLAEENTCHLSRNQQLQSQVDALERECAKAHSSISLSKKAKNADLIAQNERLQLKLQAQEEEFQLQNRTLIHELSSLAQENERLRGTLSLTSTEAEFSVQPKEQVKKLLSEASMLQKALSEERLQSTNEISKLKQMLRLFTDNMDEELQNEIFGDCVLQLAPNDRGEIDRSCSGLLWEGGSHGKDFQVEHEKVQADCDGGNNNEVKLVGTCKLAQLELAEAMQETERITKEQEKIEALEKSFTELQVMYSTYKTESEKKIEDLEYSLQLIVVEQEKQLYKYNISNGELETQIEQLRYNINECGQENEVLHSQLKEKVKVIEKLNQQLASLKVENQRKAKSLAEVEESVQGMAEEVEKLRSEKDVQVGMLEQQVVEQGLREKKGAVVCRDLKRQLAAERRRVERLQERMREVLEGTHLKIGNESSKGADTDTTSISSWSLMSGSIEQQESSTRESSLVAGSPTNMNGNLEELDLEQECRNLLERVASLQEEKWALEEKVNHLEQELAAMAQDLAKKSDVIEFYCMDGRHEPLPSSSGKKAMKKLSDLLKNTEDEYLQESNLRMQRMLEELLTKNMYLQRDMEQMSKEVEKLQQVERPEQ